MRIKRLVLVAFLMVLYIGPMVLVPFFMHTTIPTQENKVKDFQVASWYNEAWTYRKIIYINASSPDTPSAGTNYQVQIPVTYNAHMQTDFDDVLFTDDDEITLLDYWRESYIASTSAVFWVEVKDDLDLDQEIYMYYGNSTVSSVSNGTATFLMYEDWSSESIRTDVWDIITSDGGATYSPTDANHGKVAKFDANAAAGFKITSDYDTASPIAVMFRSNIEITGAGNTARQGSGYDGAFAFSLVQSAIGTQIFSVYDDDGNPDAQAMTNAYFDTWVTFQITRDGTNSKLYADTVLIETASCDPDIITTNPAASIMVGDSEDDLYSDWVAVRKFVDLEPVFHRFGEEETRPTWNEVGEVIIYFAVPFDYWALNMGLVFGGLIIMLFSVCLMAVKVRDRTITRDAGILLLFLFCVGWGLFIGGTLIG